MQILNEGKAMFYASVDQKGKISRELDIFYNPMMKFNRDVSILLLNALNIKDMQIADILAGSGVRSIRFLLELKKGIISDLVVNDHNADFGKIFKENLKLSKIKYHKNKIIVRNEDANIMLLNSSGFDYIDIDPFGSPNDFFEASIVRLSRRGILAVTATDTAPLSGTYPEACQRKYWAKPLRNHLMHEVGLRILIRKVQLIGANHDKALIPVYSYFKDHYFRIFFKCEKSKKIVDDVLKQHKYLLYCDKCMSINISALNCSICSSCNQKMAFAGPLWAGELFDEKLATQIFNDINDKSIEKSALNFLATIKSESTLATPGFYDVHLIAKKYKLFIPNFEMLISAVREKGFHAARTHFSPRGIRSDIGILDLVDLMKNI